MFDVGCRHQPNPGQPVPGGRQTAECVDHALSAVGAGAAAEAHNHVAGTGPKSGIDQFADSSAVRFDGGLRGGRSAQLRQSAGLGGLQVAVAVSGS